MLDYIPDFLPTDLNPPPRMATSLPLTEEEQRLQDAFTDLIFTPSPINDLSAADFLPGLVPDQSGNGYHLTRHNPDDIQPDVVVEN